MERPPRSREEVTRRRELRRRQMRRRRLGALAVLLALAGAAAGASIALSGAEPSATPVASPAAAEPEDGSTAAEPSADSASGAQSERRARPDGSLGARNSRLACTLLEKAEIKAQFGGSVSEPVPIWPSCQWTIGRDAWLAVWVGPKTPIQATRERSYVLEDVPGLGEDAFFGTDRYLYFGQGGASYFVVYQKANEFVEIHEDELIALARAVLSRPIDVELPASTAGEPEPVALARPTRDDPLRIYFGGDSLSAGPEWAFGESARASKLVRLWSEYQVGTGLVRSDYFDWKRHLEGVVSARRPEVVVFMNGANDSQDYVIGGTYYPNTTDVWRRRYAKRVGAVMDVLAAGGRRVVWVGMPPMRDADLNAGMERVNAIFEQEAAKRDAVTYVDTWTLFSASGGGYTDAIGGEQVRLEDGIHLNVAGSELLADAILAAVAEIAGAPELAP